MCFLKHYIYPYQCFTHGERMYTLLHLHLHKCKLYTYTYLTCMSKTRCTHNMGLSQCCVIFAFLKHHLAHILEFKHNPLSILFTQCF